MKIHGMKRPQVVDGGTASNMEGSCEYIEQAVADSRQGVVFQLGGSVSYQHLLTAQKKNTVLKSATNLLIIFIKFCVITLSFKSIKLFVTTNDIPEFHFQVPCCFLKNATAIFSYKYNRTYAQNGVSHNKVTA